MTLDLHSLLPNGLPRLRPFRTEDAAHVAAWTTRGREQGFFVPRGPVNAKDVLQWHDRLRSENEGYACWIVEESGYLDACWLGGKAELLGIWLPDSQRDRRLGRHLIRTAVAFLRDRGARQVVADVYRQNARSLAAFKAAGFLPEENDYRDAGIIQLSRHVRELRSLRTPDAAYSRLRGENVVHQHIAAAEAIAGHLAASEGIEAVLGMGSIFRGFGDVHSDIDVMILGRGAAVRRLPVGEHFVLGTSIDLFAVDLDAAPPKRWDLGRRQAVEESVLIHQAPTFDADELASAVALTEHERMDNFADALFQLGWIGCQPSSWLGQRRCGYTWEIKHDVWIQRGDLVAANALLDKALDLALALLYLLNRRHVPDLKWSRFLAADLPIVPAALRATLEFLDHGARDAASFDTRARSIQSITSFAVERREAEGPLPEDLYARFLARAPDYRKS